jgi:hypothetical protein
VRLAVVFAVCVALNYFPVFSGKIPFPRDLVLRHAAWDTVPHPAPQRGPELSDLISLFYPFHAFAAQEVRGGRLPLWNGSILSGFPFQAIAQSALLYPFNFVFAVLPMPWAWTAAMAIRMFLAALFIGLLLRELGASFAGCTVGGIVFASCGFITVWQCYGIVDSAIWLPMICYSIIRLRREPAPKNIALVAVSFAMPVLAGHPETAAHLALAGCALALFLFQKRFIARFTLGAILAIGLASVQLAPTIEWLYELKLNLSAPEPALTRHDGQGFFSRDIFMSPSSALVPIPEGASYAGLISLIAAPLAFFYRPRRYVLFFAGLVFLSLAVAFSINPFHWIVDHLPVVKAWKNGRLILIGDFGIAILAGLGVTVLERQIARRKTAWILTVMATIVAGAGIFEVVRATQSAAPLMRGPAGSAIFLAAAFLLIAFRLAGALRPGSFSAMVCLLTAAEMISFSFGFPGYARPNEIFPPAPLFQFLQNQGPAGSFRMAKFGYPIPANAGMIYGIDMAEGYYLPTERARLFTAGLREERDDGIFFLADAVVNARDRRFDLLNTKYIVVPAPGVEFDLLSRQRDRFSLVYREPTIAVFENASALPRAFAVPLSGVEVIGDTDGQLNRLKDPAFDPSQRVVLSKPLKGAGGAAEGWNSNVNLISSINGKMIFSTKTSGASVLVVSQMTYPGWRARIDGREASVVTADYALSGVAVPPGTHEVELFFDPKPFGVGAVITLVSLAILCLLWLNFQPSPFRSPALAR